MLPEYSHTKSESLAQISPPMAKIQNFSRGLFFIGAPCIWHWDICEHK